MQISVEATSTLGRKVNVVVPSEKIEEKVQSKLQELAKTVKMNGFRPGKVPVTAIKQRYGKAVHDEMVGKELQESLFDALSKEKLHPAGTPTIEFVKAEQGDDLEFTAVFEIYPDIQLADLAKVQIEKLSAEVMDQDIDNVIEKIRKQHTNWITVERGAEEGDKLVIDFEGRKEDGELFDGGKAEDVDLILGSKTFIPGFESGLVGVKGNEEKSLKLTFPKDYHVKELAGQPVIFDVKVKSVSEPELPKIDEDFAKKMGVEDGDIATLRKQVQEHMKRELESSLNNLNKKSVFDKLLEVHTFEVPQALIEQESQVLYNQRHNKASSRTNEQKSEVIPESYKIEAARRVSIGLLLGEIIKFFDMNADQDKVRAHIERMASVYEHPEQLISWYYSKKDNLAPVEALVLEDQVVAKILEQADVSEKLVSYENVMNPENSLH